MTHLEQIEYSGRDGIVSTWISPLSRITFSGEVETLREPYRDAHMARNQDFLPTASEELRPFADSRVCEPSWKRTFQPQSSIQMTVPQLTSLLQPCERALEPERCS